MPVYVYVDENMMLQGWGSVYSEGMLEIDIDPEDPRLMKLGMVKYVDGDLVEDLNSELELTKSLKDEELNRDCKAAILSGFEYAIDNVTYWFSYDMEAQGNFRDAREALKDGMVSEIPWTVRVGGETGEYSRVMITLPIILDISIQAMYHKTAKIAKYRDVLMPMVKMATSSEEVESVKW
jgi:hypothetical protein